MPRRVVYGLSLWPFLAAASCTIASIVLPNWISYTSPTTHEPIHLRYGLHTRCSSVSGTCTPFPRDDECRGEDRHFCSMWRSAAFAMNLSVILEVVVLIAYVVILCGGRMARESGWKILSALLALVAAGQLAAMALVAYLFDHDKRFFPGWELDKAWVLCTVSSAVLLLDSAGVVAASLFMSKEDDYEQIFDPR